MRCFPKQSCVSTKVLDHVPDERMSVVRLRPVVDRTKLGRQIQNYNFAVRDR